MSRLESEAELPDTSSWDSYPKLYAFGNRALANILKGPVCIEEKIDGSQFSFGVFNGQLKCRSKGVNLDLDYPEKMFSIAVEQCQKILAEGRYVDGYTYRCEYLKSSKHNTLQYDRIPKNHLIGFDVSDKKDSHLPYEDKKIAFEQIGLETTPKLFYGEVSTLEDIQSYLNNQSILGGTKVEGIVIKNPNEYDPSGHPLLAKVVSKEFQEVHQKSWKKANPTHKDIIAILGDKYTTEARWNKAIQSMRDMGQLKGDPSDIGLLIKEVPKDILQECGDDIKDSLMKWAWPQIQRIVSRGLPEYYKKSLMEDSFAGIEPENG